MGLDIKKELRNRQIFWAGVLGILIFFTHFYLIFAIIPLIGYDFIYAKNFKKSLDLITFTAYALLIIPYLSINFLSYSQ